MTEDLWRILAATIVAAGFGVSSYSRRRAHQASHAEIISLGAENPVLMRLLRLTGLALWLAVLAYLVNPRRMAWSHLQLGEPPRIGGAVIGIGSVALAFWVFASLGNNVTPTVVTRKESALVTHGPYRWVRHPLYGMAFMNQISIARVAANWFLAILAADLLPQISWRIPREEDALFRLHCGAYIAYAAPTRRLIPRIG